MDFDCECEKLEQHDGISWLYMHRPEKKNSISPQLHYEMDEALTRFDAEDVPFSPILTLNETMEDKQVKHLETFYRTSHPSAGDLTLIRRRIHTDGSSKNQPLEPPLTLGENT
jgi:crotonobetainyl-CoA:carnitine CoA-transferase CaiB-like acyl-CoA transferase